MKSNKTYQSTKATRRELMKQAGSFDGRFAPKVVQDKRKQSNKRACRTSVSVSW